MLEKFLVRDTANSGWLVFTDPVDVLQTRNPEEVLATLAEIERRVNEENLFAAGFLTYEAASGFDSAYVTHESNHLPLICFGLFSNVRRFEALNRCAVASENSSTWQMAGSRSSYVEKLLAIKRQIELGNTYQVNYTVRQFARNITEPWELFLRTAADAPYAAYVECEDHAIVSASPELFFRLNDRQLIG